jgi:hypothetical protein
MRAPKLQSLFRRISDAIDAYAQSRVHQAVPECEMRRCQDEIHRYCRMMHIGAIRAAHDAAPDRG